MNWRRAIGSGILFLVAIHLLISIATYNSDDILTGEKFIPPPRVISNWGGLWGAVVARTLVSTLGLSSIGIVIIIGIIAIAFAARKRWIVALKEALIVVGLWVILLALFGLPGGNVSLRLVGRTGFSVAGALAQSVGLALAYLISIVLLVAYLIVIAGRNPITLAIGAVRKTARYIGEKRSERKRRDEQVKRELLSEYRRKHSRQNKMLRRAKESELIEEMPDEQPPETDDQPEPKGLVAEFIFPPIKQVSKPSTAEIIGGDTEAVEASVSQDETPTVSASVQEIQEKVAPSVSEKQEETPPMQEKSSQKDISREEQPPRDENMPEQQPPPPVAHSTEEKKENETVEMHPAVEKGIEEAKIIAETAAQAEQQKSSTPEKPRRYYYQFPSVSLLVEPDEWGFSVNEEDIHRKSLALIDTFKHFKVDGEITQVIPGPVITRFEYRPSPGIKLSRIASLSDDIAMALKALSVRIIAPIPGKDVVGIEIPNEIRKTVYIKELLLSEKYKNSTDRLPLALGFAVDGTPVVADLARMPHLLIAGATGAGKSVCINSILTSLLYKLKPTELRLLLIDPKRLELSIYNGIPFLLSPVVMEPKESAEALRWLVGEMEDRYRMLADYAVRNVEDFNKKVKLDTDADMEALPYIVVVVDELADLMMTVSGEIEEPIARLAQMARAVGIHLVLATQRPSVDVITGIIKANFPSRIAFKVRTKIDSRTILDMSGADKLLGYGDMLYLPSGAADPRRVHGSFVSTAESERIVAFLRRFQNPTEPQDFTVLLEEDKKNGTSGERDELFYDAAKMVVMSGKGSASLLQRKMRIGYNRAGSLIDQLAEAGVVGPPRGSKPREVIIKDLNLLQGMIDRGEL